MFVYNFLKYESIISASAIHSFLRRMGLISFPMFLCQQALHNGREQHKLLLKISPTVEEITVYRRCLREVILISALSTKDCRKKGIRHRNKRLLY